jgi:hypothetical protein
MRAPHADHIIAGYVGRLREALSGLPSARREEMVEEIREHIAEARGALRQETDNDVLDILQRLGHPADIAAEARAGLGILERGPGPLEIAALLLVGFSGLVFPLPPVGWVLGVVLVWLSPCWTAREKRYGAYLPLVVALVVDVSALLVGPLVHLVIVPVFGASILLPLASAGVLAYRLGRRLPAMTWLAIALVGVVLVLSPLLVMLPPRSYAFVGSEGPPGDSRTNLATTHCGGLYGTTEYGFGVAGRVQTSVGVCFDGSTVRKTWGPDCYANASLLASISVKPCTTEKLGNGGLRLSMESSVTSRTSSWGWSSIGTGWVIDPDGTVYGPPG